MELELGLWRSTLGDTHPHVGFDVEMDFWPQSVHATALHYEGTAVYRLARGLVACFAGAGGGSQQATFRRELVPIVEKALERWRPRAPKLALGAKVGAYFDEVQREFDELTAPSWADQLATSAAAAYFEGGRAAIACTGIDRAFLRRAGVLSVVSTRLSVLDLTPDASQLAPEMARLLVTMPLGHLGRRAQLPDHARPWRTVELALAPGDEIVLLAGDGGRIDDRHVEEGLARATGSAPAIARSLGEYLSRPTDWSVPPAAEDATRIRWTVLSRVSIAVVRVVS